MEDKTLASSFNSVIEFLEDKKEKGTSKSWVTI